MSTGKNYEGFLSERMADFEFKWMYTETDIRKSLLNEVDRVMIERGISRHDLAEGIGYTDVKVSRLFRGTSKATIEDLAKMLVFVKIMPRFSFVDGVPWKNRKDE